MLLYIDKPNLANVSNGGYNFYQNTPQLVWLITHNLGYRPTVITFSLGGVEVKGMVESTDLLTKITFLIPLSGYARCI